MSYRARCIGRRGLVAARKVWRIICCRDRVNDRRIHSHRIHELNAEWNEWFLKELHDPQD